MSTDALPRGQRDHGKFTDAARSRGGKASQHPKPPEMDWDVLIANLKRMLGVA